MLRQIIQKLPATLFGAAWLFAVTTAYAVTFNTEGAQVSNPHLNWALHLVNTGDLKEAEAVTRKVLEEQPNLAPAQEVLGVVLGTKGDVEGAISAFERALKLDPNQSSARTKLGDVRLALGKIDEARRDFEAALAIDSTDRHGHQRLGLLEERAGRVEAAIRHLELGLVGTPTDYVGIKVNLALLYNQRLEFAKSRDLLAPYARLDDREPTMHRALGNAYLGLGDWHNAVEQYQVAVALAPKDVAARIGLGHALRDLGQKAKAITEHEIAARDAPDNSLAQIELARSRLAAGQTAQARVGLEGAQKRKPEDIRLSLALADLYTAVGESAKGVAIYETRIAAGSAPASAYVSLGVIRQAEGDFTRAEKAFRGLLQAFPESSEPYFRLGSLFGLQQRYKEARDFFNKGLALRADDQRLLKGVSVIYLRLGDKGQAVEKARTLAALTRRADDQFFLATVLESSGDIPEAVETYRVVILSAPDNWEAMNNLAFLLAGRGGNEALEAVKFAKQAAKLSPDQATVTDTLGWSQLQAGQILEAKNTLVLAVQQAPKNAKFLYHLA